jgi:hypothetical protein
MRSFLLTCPRKRSKRANKNKKSQVKNTEFYEQMSTLPHYLLVKQQKRGIVADYDDGIDDVYLHRIATEKLQNYYPYG